MIMDNKNNNNFTENGTDRLSNDIDLNDLLRTFNDDPNEVESFSCSPYIETDSLIPILSKHKGDFSGSVLSLNIKIINSKYDELLAISSELNENNINIDAIYLQETWLSADYDVAMHNIPGYQLIIQGHRCSLV